MKRTLVGSLLALGLLLAGCSDGNQSGDSNPDNFTEQSPGTDVEQPAEAPSS